MATKKKSEKIHSKGDKKAAETKAETFFTNNPVYLKEAYAAFIDWCVLTDKERKKAGLPKTQGEFAKRWEIHIDTTTDWKKRDDYPKLRWDALQKKMALETPSVIEDLRKRIKKYGMGMDIELWLAISESWDRKHVIEMKQPLQFGLGDIRALIANLPKEKQKQYYQTLGRLIADAKDAEDHATATKQSD